MCCCQTEHISVYVVAAVGWWLCAFWFIPFLIFFFYVFKSIDVTFLTARLLLQPPRAHSLLVTRDQYKINYDCCSDIFTALARASLSFWRSYASSSLLLSIHKRAQVTESPRFSSLFSFPFFVRLFSSFSFKKILSKKIFHGRRTN